MGTFERIRKVSPYALGVFVVVFIGFMVASDADIGSLVKQGNNPQTAAIGIINGEKILYQDYELKVKQAIEQQRTQMQNPDAEIDENQIRNQVWDQMVNEVLTRQEAEKAGIRVTDEEIADVLLESPPEFLARSFTDSAGNFNRQLYLELVTNPEKIVNYMGQDPTQMDPAEKEKAVANFRNDLLNISDYLRSQKYSNALTTTVTTAGSQISPLFAKTTFKNENSTANVNFIFVNPAEIATDKINISDKEIQDYYDSHKQYYNQKYQRKIKFSTLEIAPSADDSARSNKRIQRILEDLQKGMDLASTDSIFDLKMSEYSGTTNEWTMFQDIDPMKVAYFANAPERQVVGPVRLPDGNYFFRLDGRRSGENVVVKASHVLIGFGPQNNKDSALKLAQTVLKKARGGEDFGKLATDYSTDKGSAAQGGDLGFFGKGRMVKPFEEAAFAANVGQIVGPVESQFGYHVIKVTDKKSDEIQYSEIKINPTISNPTRNKILMDAHSFVKQSEEGVDFDSLAKRLNLSADTTDFFPRAFPLFGSWDLTNKVFDSEIGTVLQPKDLKKQGIVIVKILDERKEGTADLASVKKEITDKLVKRKQLDMLKDKAFNIYNEVKVNSDLSLATQYEVRNAAELKNDGSIPGLGLDVVFTGNIFKSATGKVLEPVRGTNGWYIAQINTMQVPDDKAIEEGVKLQMEKLKQVAKNQAYNNWFQKIKEIAKIEDLRGKFFTDY